MSLDSREQECARRWVTEEEEKRLAVDLLGLAQTMLRWWLCLGVTPFKGLSPLLLFVFLLPSGYSFVRTYIYIHCVCSPLLHENTVRENGNATYATAFNRFEAPAAAIWSEIRPKWFLVQRGRGFDLPRSVISIPIYVVSANLLFLRSFSLCDYLASFGYTQGFDGVSGITTRRNKVAEKETSSISDGIEIEKFRRGN